MKLKLILITLLCCTVGYAQKKEKIKGNRFVKVKQHPIESFKSIEFGENLEVYLVKGPTAQVEIEADENLHDVILFEVKNETLRITTTHNIASKKKLNIRVTFTSAFNTVSIKDKAIVNSLTDLSLDDLTITAKDAAKVYMTVSAKTFKLIGLNKTKTELNLQAENSVIELSESSDIKALINSDQLNFDLYQKANAKIEGDVKELLIRADNATNFKGSHLTSKKCELVAEGSSDCHVEVKDSLSITASGSCEVYIYDNPDIVIKKFADSARLYKK